MVQRRAQHGPGAGRPPAAVGDLRALDPRRGPARDDADRRSQRRHGCPRDCRYGRWAGYGWAWEISRSCRGGSGRMSCSRCRARPFVHGARVEDTGAGVPWRSSGADMREACAALCRSGGTGGTAPSGNGVPTALVRPDRARCRRGRSRRACGRSDAPSAHPGFRDLRLSRTVGETCAHCVANVHDPASARLAETKAESSRARRPGPRATRAGAGCAPRAVRDLLGESRRVAKRVNADTGRGDVSLPRVFRRPRQTPDRRLIRLEGTCDFARTL